MKAPHMRHAAAATALILSLTACAATSRDGPERLRDASIKRGHRVAERVCAACHAVEPAGVSPAPRAPAFASLKMRHTASLTGRVEELTRKGHYAMPPLALTPGEVRDVVAYIASLDVAD